jgi:peptidoglycan/LPS O-acetylase OafA/YrhL
MKSNQDTGTGIHTKQHYEILDGLRGVAALAVVIFHFMEWVYTDPSQNFIGHCFLAVDFFFCMSGFVIGYAYDDRISKMGIKEFFKARLIRLQPLVISGSVLGLLAFLFDPFGGHPELYSTGKIVLTLICSLLMIPLPVIEDRGFNLFSFNAPAWSLFWEYVANIAYALVLSRLKRSLLVIFTLLSAVAICLVAYRSGNLLGGWSGPTFWDGCARISYSFSAGLLIYRFNWIIQNKMGFITLSILLMLALLFPSGKWNWLTEPFIVLIYFPLLLALGAGAVIKPGLRKACIFSGQISYPLYMTHYALLWMFGNYLTNFKPEGSTLTLTIILGVIVCLVAGYLAMVLYDIPLRRYLSNIWRKNRTYNT